MSWPFVAVYGSGAGERVAFGAANVLFARAAVGTVVIVVVVVAARLRNAAAASVGVGRRALWRQLARRASAAAF